MPRSVLNLPTGAVRPNYLNCRGAAPRWSDFEAGKITRSLGNHDKETRTPEVWQVRQSVKFRSPADEGSTDAQLRICVNQIHPEPRSDIAQFIFQA